MRWSLALTLGCFILIAPACFHASAYLVFGGEGTRERVVNLPQGTVAFAQSVDISYEGDASARWDIDLLQNGKVVSSTVCSALTRGSQRSCLVYVNVGESHVIDCRWVLACTATVPVAGPTIVRARFWVPVRPPGFTLKRANLIVGHQKGS